MTCRRGHSDNSDAIARLTPGSGANLSTMRSTDCFPIDATRLFSSTATSGPQATVIPGSFWVHPSSTNRMSLLNRDPRAKATSKAKRVFPTPGGPSNTTSRSRPLLTNSMISRCSRIRPTNIDRGMGGRVGALVTRVLEYVGPPRRHEAPASLMSPTSARRQEYLLLPMPGASAALKSANVVRTEVRRVRKISLRHARRETKLSQQSAKRLLGIRFCHSLLCNQHDRHRGKLMISAWPRLRVYLESEQVRRR